MKRWYWAQPHLPSIVYFNVDFKDDKSYPFIAITESDVFPAIKYTREKHKKERHWPVYGLVCRSSDYRYAAKSGAHLYGKLYGMEAMPA